MGTWVIMRILGLGLLTAVSLSACSLEQRSAESGYARIQLNTRSHFGGPARLATIPGAAAPNTSSYYVLDVEGEGIPRSIVEPQNCFRVSPVSSVMISAFRQAGEPERTEVELLVPIGINRKVRIYRVEISLAPGTEPPRFGESPFAFKMRNPQHDYFGEKHLLAEAEIPVLNGDQSVTVVERPIAQPLGNQCPGGGPPPISNGEVVLSNYFPNSSMVFWNSPFELKVNGRIRKALMTDSLSVTPPTASFPGTGAVTPQQPGSYTLLLGPPPNTFVQDFSQVFQVTPLAGGASGNASVSLSYSGSGYTQSPISWSFPFLVRTEGAPASVTSINFNTPFNVSSMGGSNTTYSNTFSVNLVASNPMELMPASPDDIMAYFTGSGGGPEVELSSAPPSAPGTPCPLKAGSQPVSHLVLNPGQSCQYYVRVYQHLINASFPMSASARYVIKISSKSNGMYGQQTARVVDASEPNAAIVYSGTRSIPTVYNFNEILINSSGVQSFPSGTLIHVTGTGYVIPSSGQVEFERVFVRYQNGVSCSSSGGDFCGLKVNPSGAQGLVLPSHASGSRPVFARVVVRVTHTATPSSTVKFYKQEVSFGGAYVAVAEDDAVAELNVKVGK